MKEIKYHNRYPIGMIKGNKNQVFTKRGTELTIKVSKKDNSRYVTLTKSFSRLQYVNVDRLYMELFLKQKKSAKYTHANTQTIFSKGDLKQQNRKGVYITNQSRGNIISITGWILYGQHKGKKLSQLTDDELMWYVNNMQLKNNEEIEMNKELNKRGLR